MILGIMGGSLVFHPMSAEKWRGGVAVLLIIVAMASLANTTLSWHDTRTM